MYSILNHKSLLVHNQDPTAGDIDEIERALQMPYNPFDRLRKYIFVMLGDVNTNDVNNSATDQLDLTFLHVVYTFLASLLLQSLLVAMMSETYARERENEGFAMWWMYRACVVLCREKQHNKRDRNRLRLGEDLDVGKANPECRPFFDISVGGMHDIIDSRKTVDHTLSTNFLLRQILQNIDGTIQRFAHMEESIHELVHSRTPEHSRARDHSRTRESTLLEEVVQMWRADSNH